MSRELARRLARPGEPRSSAGRPRRERIAGTTPPMVQTNSLKTGFSPAPQAERSGNPSEKGVRQLHRRPAQERSCGSAPDARVRGAFLLTATLRRLRNAGCLTEREHELLDAGSRADSERAPRAGPVPFDDVALKGVAGDLFRVQVCTCGLSDMICMSSLRPRTPYALQADSFRSCRSACRRRASGACPMPSNPSKAKPSGSTNTR